MDVALKIAGIFEYGILALLFLLSIWSIAIMIEARRRLARETSLDELEKLRSALSGGKVSVLPDWIRSHPGLHADALATAMKNAKTGDVQVDREVRSFLAHERIRLEKGLATLATLGANAPFMGLFGTVLGIIRAFAALGGSAAQGPGPATSVMSGISQALVATAAGLFVAIPAVIAFNAFSQRVRVLISQCESLKDLYIANRADQRESG